MYVACDGGHVEIVKLLLSVNGVDVNKGVSIALIYWIVILNIYSHCDSM